MTNLFFIIWKNKVNSRRTGVTRFTEQTHSSSSRAASGAERRLLLESSEGLAASSAAVKERFCRAEKRVLFLFGSDGAASRPAASWLRRPNGRAAARGSRLRWGHELRPLGAPRVRGEPDRGAEWNERGAGPGNPVLGATGAETRFCKRLTRL